MARTERSTVCPQLLLVAHEWHEGRVLLSTELD